MDAHWRAVRRDLDATERGRDAPTPKKRTLVMTPSIFLEVDAARKRDNRLLWRPPEYLYVGSRGEKRQIKKVGVIPERHKKKRHKKVMEIIETCDSEQAYKKSNKKAMILFCRLKGQRPGKESLPGRRKHDAVSTGTERNKKATARHSCV